MIELPLRHPELFKRLGVEAPKGVLLHGAPGSGKTLLASVIANETKLAFYSLSGPEIMGKFYGESEESCVLYSSKQINDTFYNIC
jgi:transitional endoplasmic reticulum ATPase